VKVVYVFDCLRGRQVLTKSTQKRPVLPHEDRSTTKVQTTRTTGNGSCPLLAEKESGERERKSEKKLTDSPLLDVFAKVDKDYLNSDYWKKSED